MILLKRLSKFSQQLLLQSKHNNFRFYVKALEEELPSVNIDFSKISFSMAIPYARQYVADAAWVLGDHLAPFRVQVHISGGVYWLDPTKRSSFWICKSLKWFILYCCDRRNRINIFCSHWCIQIFNLSIQITSA